MVAAIWIVPSAVFLALAWSVYDRYRIRVPARLGPEARAEAMRVVRAALDGDGVERPAHAELERPLADGGPVVITVWDRGEARVRVSARGDTAAAAIEGAARRLAEDPEAASLHDGQRRRARIKVDVVVGRGPIHRGVDALTQLGLNPGLEGVGARLDDGSTHLLLPDELMLHRLLFHSMPIGLIPDVELGLDLERADMVLAQRAGLPPGGWGATTKRYFRFRTDAFVERPAGARDAPPLPLTRGLPPGPEVTAESLRAAALSGARYLEDHLDERGRYVYIRDLTSGNTPGGYSLPRHAGTTYFLAEVYRLTGEAWLREPIERAFAYLEQLVSSGACRTTAPSGATMACVVEENDQHASLGSTALTVVALVEYQRATGETTYAELARALTEWILYMQRDDGSFRHRYHVATGEPDEDAHLLYFAGEAALALARMHEVTGEPRYAAAAEAALDELVGSYDFFLGGFFFAEEHWTCIAAEALWPAVKKKTYLDFCREYGRFLRSQQPARGDHPDQVDLVGSYGVTPFILPNNTPAGSRSEAMVSTYALSRHHGEPDEEVLAQVLRALGYALRQQIRADNDYQVAAGFRAHGAIPSTPIDRRVRIDYVQHVGSAMIRASELLDREDPQ